MLDQTVNEAIINAFKHAFEGKERGVIQIDFSGEETYSLMIRDDGVGFPDDFDPEYSMGLTLISDLVEQLEGEIKFDNLNKIVVLVLNRT